MVSVEDVVSRMLDLGQDVVCRCIFPRERCVSDDGGRVLRGTVDRFCVSEGWEEDNQ